MALPLWFLLTVLVLGATLDRNGLRPGRYLVTKDGLVIMASEAGVLEIEPEQIKEKGRLAPGKIFVVDMEKGRIVRDNEVKKPAVSRQTPYRRWLNIHKIELSGLLQAPRDASYDPDTMTYIMQTFGYTYEDVRKIIVPMAVNAQEPVGSMGNDSALAVLSESPILLYDLFPSAFRPGHQSSP